MRIKCLTNESIKKFVVDQGILGEVSLHHQVCELFQENFSQNQTNEGCHKNALGCHIEYIDEVDCIYSKKELMA